MSELVTRPGPSDCLEIDHRISPWADGPEQRDDLGMVGRAGHRQRDRVDRQLLGPPVPGRVDHHDPVRLAHDRLVDAVTVEVDDQRDPGPEARARCGDGCDVEDEAARAGAQVDGHQLVTAGRGRLAGRPGVGDQVLAVAAEPADRGAGDIQAGQRDRPSSGERVPVEDLEQAPATVGRPKDRGPAGQHQLGRPVAVDVGRADAALAEDQRRRGAGSDRRSPRREQPHERSLGGRIDGHQGEGAVERDESSRPGHGQVRLDVGQREDRPAPSLDTQQDDVDRARCCRIGRADGHQVRRSRRLSAAGRRRHRRDVDKGSGERVIARTGTCRRAGRTAEHRRQGEGDRGKPAGPLPRSAHPRTDLLDASYSRSMRSPADPIERC